MNKAFVRKPELDGRGYCPRCGSLGTAVVEATLDAQIEPASRARLGDSAWFCGYAACEVVYFDSLERTIEVGQLRGPVYPKDADAPICPCFGFTWDDVQADIRDTAPTRIRQLLAKSKTDAARCRLLAADGRCCLPEVQRLYMRGKADLGS